MSLNTSIRGLQIKDAFFGIGLIRNAGDGDVMDLDLSSLSAVAVDVSADEVAIVDATDGSTKKEAIADIMTAVAGDGIGVASGVLAIDLNELTGAVIDVSADAFAFVDATDNSSKKEAIADLVSAMAGAGLTATSGVLSADSITDNVTESDIVVENESANCNGATTDFTLDNTPLTASVQVYLNGLLQESGSGKDYTLTGTTVAFATAPETGDILLIHYIKNN